MMRKAIFIIMSLLVGLNSVYAQKPKQVQKKAEPSSNQTTQRTVDTVKVDKAYEADINVMASYRGDSIVLRWAPETPGAWRELNKVGYVIWRTTLDESGSFDPVTFQTITPDPIKPWPLERWAGIAAQNSKDDFAKIAAQALYGKSFMPVAGFIGQADEFSTRFSFAMLAADMSLKTASALGVRLVDRNIEKGKTYIYRVMSPVDTAKYKINPGVVVISTTEHSIVPKAYIDGIKERENLIELQWKRDFHDPYFSAYYIERSDDNGKSYRRLNKSPFIHPESEKNPVTAENIVYLDSVTANYKTYWYRIVGITPFAEQAPPSDPVRAMGKDKTPPAPPMKVKAQHIGGTRVKITWDYPKQSKDIKGFLVGRGDNPAKQFMPLVTDPLPAKTREYTDDRADVMASNYYIVAAVDTAGNASLSLAHYAMIVDSIPPSPPTGLIGNIDSTGRVTIKWKLGPEPDIQGYLVFFANKPDHEFSQLTNGPLQDTVFRDSITLKTLTKKIYYRVVAIDYNSNYSKFSQILELKRPDVVPPSAAVMDHYKVTEKGIELKWIPSSSEDVSKTILYRWDEIKKDWRPIATFLVKDKKNAYTDTTGLKAGNIYSYSLVVVDEDGLQSKRSVPIKLKYADFSQRQAVNNVFAQPNAAEKSIFVNWNYPVKGEYRFILYRAVDGSSFASYKTLSGTISSFKDKEVKKGSSYEYSVGVIYKDGKKAPFGKIVKTTFN